MIYYNHDREVITEFIKYEPRSCFVMTQLGTPVSHSVTAIRAALVKELNNRGIKELDALSQVKGKDYLSKIWRLVQAVPMGIAIVTEEMNSSTISNIFYEVGVLNALGKETIVIKSPGFKIPSDFIRTEYIEFNSDFTKQLNKFLDEVFELADHYELVGEALEANPVLTVDYYKRAFLISGDSRYFKMTKEIIQKIKLDKQSKFFVTDFLAIEKRLERKALNESR